MREPPEGSLPQLVACFLQRERPAGRVSLRSRMDKVAGRVVLPARYLGESYSLSVMKPFAS